MELKEKVELLISEIDKTHRYSMSRIYGLYNEVFEKSEVAQSCASCLIRKVNSMREWLKKQEVTEVKPLAKKKKQKPLPEVH